MFDQIEGPLAQEATAAAEYYEQKDGSKRQEMCSYYAERAMFCQVRGLEAVANDYAWTAVAIARLAAVPSLVDTAR